MENNWPHYNIIAVSQSGLIFVESCLMLPTWHLNLNTLNKQRIFYSILVLSAFVAALLPSSFSDHLSPGLSDALHFPAAMLLLRWLHLCFGHRIPAIILFTLAVISLALLEWVQALIGRAAEWSDFWHGCLGLILVHFWSKLPKLLRHLLLVFGMLYGGREFLSTQLYYWQLQESLPQLTTAPWLATSHGWQPISGSNIERIVNSNRQLQYIVHLKHQQWQGMQWQNPGLDLTSISELCFSAIGSGLIELQIRIDDTDSVDYASRFHSSIRLHEEWQRFCLDVRTLTDTNKRLMKKQDIVAIYWFSKPLSSEPQSWFALANVSAR